MVSNAVGESGFAEPSLNFLSLYFLGILTQINDNSLQHF